MPTTSYDRADLTNEQVIVNSFHNSSNIGGPAPAVNINGSFSNPGFSLTGAQTSNSENCAGALTYLYDIDHSSPIDPVQPGAHITRVTIRMQSSALAANGAASVTFPAEGPIGFPGGHLITGAQVVATVLPVPMDTSLGTSGNVSESDSDSTANGSGLQSCSSACSHAGVFLGYEFDFTTNPGGLFPLGYMTYADFLTNFTNLIFAFNSNSNGGAQWFAFSPPDHPTPATGSVSGSATLTANNFSMDVEWNLPLSWTVTPTTVNYPDNVITIERPDPGISPDEDDEIIETVYINDKPIKPNDPWVIIWTRVLIIIHINIRFEDDPDNELVIEVDLVDTEFTGKVDLQTLTVNYADLSGIYFLDSTSHHDTLYARTTTSTTVTTQDVAIPAPFFVTAFIDDPEEDVCHYTGVRMRVTGVGSLKQIFQSMDNINTEALVNTTLKTSNNTVPFMLANFVDQDANLRVYMDTLDDFMNVSKIVIFSKALYTGYPQ